MEGLGDNPLPASYEVRLRAGADQAVDSLLAEVRQLPGVADVRYDRQWLQRLLAAIGVVRGLGLVLGILLTIAAALTVANVVRLALYARRDELDIMQLVGAPQVYIRGPFVDGGDAAGRAGCDRGARRPADGVSGVTGPLPRAARGDDQPVVGEIPADRALRSGSSSAGWPSAASGGLIAAAGRA